MSLFRVYQNLSKTPFLSCVKCRTLNTNKIYETFYNVRNLNCYFKRQNSSSVQQNDVISFESMLEKRRKESQRTILVQVHSDQSCSDLYKHCSQFGIIESMFHYTLPDSSAHFVLVEFSNEEGVKSVLSSCAHLDATQVVPVQSPFLWFRAQEKKSKLQKKAHDNTKIPIYYKQTDLPSNNELYDLLMQAENISDQMLMLYNGTCLNEIGARLRFLTAHQVEAAIKGLFPQTQCLPFGSSVNGFGKLNCDLDIAVKLDGPSGKDSSNCRLIFHTKTSLSNGRSQVQRYMETLADMIQLFMPGCSGVKRILQARVPIVKYKQDLTGVDCDLSMTNMTAVHMSELLYTFGCIDWRVRLLVFTVKHWAAAVNLTNSSPGRWITNFSLTLLVIFYLQQVKILPSIDMLQRMARSVDKRISDDGVNCTFLRDVSSFQTNPVPEVSTLTSLLLGFFEYYATFDFGSKAVALGPGIPIPKQDYSPLYIINPLEQHLNVSKNVSLEETERLKVELRNAAWQLESMSHVARSDKSDQWGLVELFKESHMSVKTRNLFLSALNRQKADSRLLTVKDLFENNENSNKSDNVSKNSSESSVRTDIQRTKPVSKVTLTRRVRKR